MKNKNLIKAKAVKNDEFYTLPEDVAAEMENYLPHLRGKVVYCNCDDPAKSNFTKFFIDNFHRIGLKKLISTSYKDPQYDIFSQDPPGIPDCLIYDGVEKKITKLKGSGGYRSQECDELLRQSDIVVTNPPFSLFRDFIDFLISRNKKFIVLGNANSASCIGIVENIRDGILWFGVNNRAHSFRIPRSEKENYNSYFEKDGKSFVKIGTIVWYTNVDHDFRPGRWVNKEKFNPDNFEKYINLDAINIDKSEDVPSDYGGLMGVPVTFIPKLNIDQFEILFILNSNDQVIRDGKPIHPFKRIIIRNRELSDES